MYRGAEDSTENTDGNYLGVTAMVIKICVFAFLSTYTYLVIGSSFYLEVAKVFVCTVFIVGLLRLLFQLTNVCSKSENEDGERERDQNWYFKVELICWLSYFTIFGSIGTFSLYSISHPAFVAPGVGHSFYLFLTWVCGALFLLGCLKLFLDFLIEHKSRLIPLPRNHPARNHLGRRRQLCEGMINWLLFFIIIACFGVVSWKNTEKLGASSKYPVTSFISVCLTSLLICMFIGGLWEIFSGLVGKRTTWRDEENRPAWIRWLLSKRLENAVTFVITPVRIYSYRPFPKRTRQLPKRTGSGVSTVTETMELTPTRRRGGQGLQEQQTPGESTVMVEAIIERPPSTSQPVGGGSPLTHQQKKHQNWMKRDHSIGKVRPTGWQE